MYSFWLLVIIFFFYSVVGYIVEVTSCSINNKKVTLSRGYLTNITPATPNKIPFSKQILPLILNLLLE